MDRIARERHLIVVRRQGMAYNHNLDLGGVDVDPRSLRAAKRHGIESRVGKGLRSEGPKSGGVERKLVKLKQPHCDDRRTLIAAANVLQVRLIRGVPQSKKKAAAASEVARSTSERAPAYGCPGAWMKPSSNAKSQRPSS
ncbi:hypothetical protein BP6252_12827 [Coleophoma cylindrospora]|uniref:Uncharacterized protein n=1 Tax=Coleophoma cylindrospora TaxID=1849047 RepID=A0A3D8QDK4_9HELO|nr:hypothetical protein BP6252_12827 [Coleophoma cylindrospora]